MFRVMVVGALVVGSTLLSSCSCTANCSPANCNGCCDSIDLCHTAINDNACGAGGNSCDVCVSGQTCSAGGSCQPTGTAGDGGTIVTGDGGVIVGGSTISGRVTYDFVPSTYTPGSTTGTLNFAGATKRPVRNGVILVLQGTTTIGNSTTDADGKYQVTYAPSGTGEIRVYALSRTTTPAIQVQDNTDQNATYAVSAVVGGTAVIDLHAAHGWTGAAFGAARNASPFAVLDTMYTSAQAFLAVRPAAVFPALKVNWSENNAPQSGDLTQGLIGTSHYNRMANQIYVLGKSGADIDEFDGHVIAHEWGHFFEFNLSRSDSPGGRHGPGDILDPRIAFGEAWGNALSAMVLKDPVYADCTWGSSGLRCFGWDSETEPTPSDDPTPSAFSESSVLRALYDLYDSSSAGEAYDQISLGLGPIYDTMVGPEKTTPSVTTLASFITGLKAQTGVNATQVDTLLAHWNIGSIRNEFGRDDSNLTDMFTNATALPFSGGIGLGGGNLPNTWQQNQYYVFEGNGANVTITAQSVYDVAITLYQEGKVIQTADANESGTETISSATVNGAAYVLVLTGFGQTPGDYDVSINIQ